MKINKKTLILIPSVIFIWLVFLWFAWGGGVMAVRIYILPMFGIHYGADASNMHMTPKEIEAWEAQKKQ